MTDPKPGLLFRLRYEDPEGLPPGHFAAWLHVNEDTLCSGPEGYHIYNLLMEFCKEPATPERFREEYVERSGRKGARWKKDWRAGWDGLKKLGYLQERIVEKDGAAVQFVSVTHERGQFHIDVDVTSDDELLDLLADSTSSLVERRVPGPA